MPRKFYYFGDFDKVKEHLATIKTVQDLEQLFVDIKQSLTNLASFQRGVEGVYAVNIHDEDGYRHVFMTQEAHEKYGDPFPESDQFAILERAKENIDG